MKRVLLDNESEVKDRKVKLENAKRIQEIILKKNTTGVLDSYNEKYVHLYFEEGDDKQITFEASESRFILY